MGSWPKKIAIRQTFVEKMHPDIRNRKRLWKLFIGLEVVLHKVHFGTIWRIPAGHWKVVTSACYYNRLVFSLLEGIHGWFVVWEMIYSAGICSSSLSWLPASLSLLALWWLLAPLSLPWSSSLGVCPLSPFFFYKWYWRFCESFTGCTFSVVMHL